LTKVNATEVGTNLENLYNSVRGELESEKNLQTV